MVRPEVANSARSPADRRPAQPHRDGGADGVGHLRGQRALPDQLVETELVAGQGPGQFAGRAERVAGRTDGLVGLLGVLDLAGVRARLGRDVGVAVELAGLGAGGGERGLRQVGRVRAHIGDVAVLVQPLGHPHDDLGGPAELAPGLLLQRRGHERRVGAPAVRLLLDPSDLEVAPVQAGGQAAGAGLVEVDDVGAGPAGGRVEIAAGGDADVVHRDQGGREGGRVGRALAPVWSRAGAGLARRTGRRCPRRPSTRRCGTSSGPARARRPCAWPPTARARPTAGAAPSSTARGDLVAVEPVEDAAGLLGVDQIACRSRAGSSTARAMACGVISWNTIRRTGILGASVWARCQAMASPSRSSSVAR